MSLIKSVFLASFIFLIGCAANSPMKVAENQNIQKTMIKIYTKNYCPYCTKAKSLLDSLNVKYEEEDITDHPELINELVKKSGMMTVPQIFANDNCLGGYSDIEKLHQEGKLEKLLMVE